MEPLTVVALADLHGHLPEIPRADLLLLAGDLAPYAIERDAVACAAWIGGELSDWLRASGSPVTVGIAGNHDWWAEGIGPGVHPDLHGAPWTFLQDAEVTAAGLRVYGSPWTPDVYGAAFEAPAARLHELWAPIPDGLDVLMVHCPPRGFGDTLVDADETIHMGADALTDAIRRTAPRLAVFGHAHQQSGFRGRLGASELANVAVRDDYGDGLAPVSRFAIGPERILTA